MPTYQIFNKEGRSEGVVKALSKADAVRFARQAYGDFPIVIKLPDELKGHLTIPEIKAEKEALEKRIEKFLCEQLTQFQKVVGYQVEDVDITFNGFNAFGVVDTILKVKLEIGIWDSK